MTHVDPILSAPEILSALQVPKIDTDGKALPNGLMRTKPEIKVAIIASAANIALVFLSELFMKPF